MKILHLTSMPPLTLSSSSSSSTLLPKPISSSLSSKPFSFLRIPPSSSSAAILAGNRLLLLTSGSASRAQRSRFRRPQVECCSLEKGASAAPKAAAPSSKPSAEPSFLVKAAWYAAEAFGNVVSALKPRDESAAAVLSLEQQRRGDDGAKSISRDVAVQALRRDFESSYFVTGDMSMDIYEPDCEFVDPFVSFKGLGRFKTNVSNLGSFMEESNLKVLDWQESEDKIYARWRFNCVLALPWRPILAATGSTEYYFNQLSGRIYRHVEMWDISPVDGLRQLVKPNPKLQKVRKAQ